MEREIREIIQFYLSNNISFFPLFPSTKIPVVKHSPYYTRLPEKNELEAWFKTYLNPQFWKLIWERGGELKERWLKALEQEFKKINRDINTYQYEGEVNIAVAGGYKDLVLIDIEDASKISTDPEKILTNYGLLVKTGKPNGYHLWVRCKNWTLNVKGENGEIRVLNQYVAAPPSRHPSGTFYRFIGGKIDDVTAAWIEDTVFEWIKAKKEEKKEEKQGLWEVIFEKAKEIPVVEGKRSDWLFALTYTLKALNLSREEAYKKIKEIPVCVSKLEEKKDPYDWWVRYEWDIIDSPKIVHIPFIIRWAEKITGIGNISETIGEYFKKVKNKGYGYALNESELVMEIFVLLSNCIENENEKQKLRKDYIHIISIGLDQLFYFKAIYEFDELYMYKDGIYIPCEDFIARLLQKVWDNSEIKTIKALTTRDFNEIINQLKRRNYIRYENIYSDVKKYVNFKNGLLNLETLKLEPHDPEKFFLTQIPHNYNPNAKSELFESFLHDVFPEQYHTVLQEFIGYCLLPDCRFEKSLVIVGREGTGKSTFLEAIRNAFGKDNVTHFSIQQLEIERFARVELIGKLINIYNDLPYESIEDSAIFKQISSGDPVNVEKKFVQPFSAKIYTKLIFAANQLPKPRDWSGAFFRRWIIVEVNSAEKRQIDPLMKEKMKNEEVAEAILIWAIEGLQRLLKNNKFSYNFTIEEIAEKYESMADSVAYFVNECLEEALDGKIAKDELYHRYLEFCRENSVIPVGKIEFGRKLKIKMRVGETRSGDKRYWTGIRYKLIENESEEISSTFDNFIVKGGDEN
jgi:putative DNA primase/helicase